MEIGNRIKILRTHYCGGNNEMFASAIGERPNTVSNWINRNPGNISVLKKLIDAFPDLNIGWVIKGEGDMLKKNISMKILRPEDLPIQVGKLHRSPIYESFPFSTDEQADMKDHKPNGYAFTSMPGIKFFPVVGCSFEPTILAGHYIGAVRLESYNRVDTEKIYYIHTKKERMIKRLRVDEKNQDILWAVSPNFQEFKIMKEDILEISHVFFYGMMV